MRRDQLRLQDILENIEAVKLALGGRSREEFNSDLLLRSAILHYLQTIGEAASHISAEMQDKYPDVPWREVSGTRNVIVHAYFSVDLDLIWQTITQDLLPLHSRISAILKTEFPANAEPV
jgi:uncharacterized protein with HEPN domain